jgi:hypothetical protein
VDCHHVEQMQAMCSHCEVRTCANLRMSSRDFWHTGLLYTSKSNCTTRMQLLPICAHYVYLHVLPPMFCSVPASVLTGIRCRVNFTVTISTMPDGACHGKPPGKADLTRSVPPYLSNPPGKGLPREEGLARSVQPLARAPYEGLTRPAIRLSFIKKGQEGL